MEEKLQQALRMLRAIRQRHETGRGVMHSYTVHVALSNADMLWITAAIKALEKAITVGQPEIEQRRDQRRISRVKRGETESTQGEPD